MGQRTFQVGVEFIANVNDLQSKVKAVTGDIAKMGSTTGGSQVQKHFDRLTQSVQNLQTRAQQPITSQAEFNRLTSELNKAEGEYNNLIAAVERMHSMSASKRLELLPPEEQAKIRNAAAAITAYDAEAKKASADLEKVRSAQERANQAAEKQRGLAAVIKKNNAELTKKSNQLDKVRAAAKSVEMAEKNLNDAMASGKGEKEVADLRLQLEQAKEAAARLGVAFQEGVSPAESAKATVKRLGDEVRRLGSTKTSLGKEFEAAKVSAERLQQEADELQSKLQSSGSTGALEQAFERLKAKAKALGVDLKGIDDAGQIDELKNRLQQLESQGLERVDAEITQVAGSLQGELRQGLNSARQGLDGAAQGFQKFNRAAQEMDQLKSQLGYFFSLTNSVYLLRSALQSAFETVKELDAVMTETAVVTDFSVGDMWDKLPEYASIASELGSSIKDVYAATTLYYQQGLKTNEAMSVGAETMKMARIAGMDAAEATQAMTAALRGFNMEVNENNSLRINDVYSNLAAITAADTEQIATAMSKTASIASSANMEFETTAALLAQIIETTQEAPETAGTALKTIIARFSEVKELQSRGETTGEDEEGELIDVNKISKALSSVGISMSGFFAGTEGLDSVLLKLAEKWDTLDFTTQRYIATMAAGSRQQSRFIAMMSDYGRTTELVTAANNSAGASQKQFDKTMESLEAKVNKLKVAWDQFTMGIADNTLIKVGIDLLTGLLETINKLLSGLPGLTKSFASLGIVFVALRAGGALLNKVLAGISGAMAKGVIDAGTAAGVIKQAEGTGKAAGMAAAKGTAMGVNNPAAQASLFKSYNLLFWKVQSTLPPVVLKTSLDPTASPTVKKLWAEVKRLKIEEEKVAATYGKNSPQYAKVRQERIRAAQAAQAARVANTTETASINGVTVALSKEMAAKMKEGTITKTQLALMGPEAAARVSNALATGAEEKEIEELVWAKTTEKNLAAGGLKRLFTEIGLRYMNVTATQTEKGGIWGVVKAKFAEAVAWIKANSAMLMGIAVVAIYIAAIALLIAGIVKLVKAWENAKNANEKAIEAMDKAVSEFGEQAAKAKDALNEIADSKDGLENLQDEFKGLAKGTTEWKKKLVEVNSQVLELVSKYPELATFITRGVNGELAIADAGWDALEERANAQYHSALNGQIGAQLVKTEIQGQVAIEEAQSEELQRKYDYDRYVSNKGTKTGATLTGAGAGAAVGAVIGSVIPALGTIVGAVIGTVVGAVAGMLGVNIADWVTPDEERITKKETGMSSDDYQAFVAKASEEGLTVSSGTSRAEYEDLFNRMGFGDEYDFSTLYSHIREIGAEFDELGASTLGLQLAQKAYAESLVTQTAINNGVADEDYGLQATEVVIGKSIDSADAIAERADELKHNDEYATENKDGSFTATEKLINEYAEAQEMTPDEVRGLIESGSLSVDTMVTGVATKQKTDEVSDDLVQTQKQIADTVDNYKRFGRDASQMLRILSANGANMQQGDAEWFYKNGGQSADSEEEQKQLVEQFMSDFGYTFEEWGLEEGDWKVIWEHLNEGAAQFSDAAVVWDNLGVDMNDKLNAGSASGLAGQVGKYLTQGASGDQAREVTDLVNEITEGMSEEDANAFVSTLNGIDWSNAGAVENFSETLNELGISFVGMEDKVADLENQVKDFADSTYKLSEEEKNAMIDGQADFKAKIMSGQRTFTAQEVTTYFSPEQIKKYFTQHGSNYTLSSESVTGQQLLDAMNNYTGAEQVPAAEADWYSRQGIIENNTDSEIVTYSYAYGGDFKTEGNTLGALWNEGTKSTSGAARGYLMPQTDGAIYTNSSEYQNSSFYGRAVYYDEDEGRYEDDFFKVDSLEFGRERTSDNFMKNFGSGSGNKQAAPYVAYYYANFGGGSYIHPNDIISKLGNAGYDQWLQKMYNTLAGFTDDQRLAFYLAADAVFADPSKIKDYDWKTKIVPTYFKANKSSNGTTVSTDTTTQGDIFEMMFSDDAGEGKIKGYQFQDKSGHGIMSNDSLKQFFNEIFPDGALDAEGNPIAEDDYAGMLWALENYYNTTMTNGAKLDNTSSAREYAKYFNTATTEEVTNGLFSPIAAKREAAKIEMNRRLATQQGAGELASYWNKNGTYSQDQQASLSGLALQIDGAVAKMEGFKEVVDATYEVLSKGPEEGGFKYFQALDQMTYSMQVVFGGHITTDKVQQMIPYLEDIAKGGNKAAESFRNMAKSLAIFYATQEGSKLGWTDQDKQDYYAVVNYLASYDGTGPLSLEQIYEQLKLKINYDQLVYALMQNGAFQVSGSSVKMDENGNIVSAGEEQDTHADDMVGTIFNYLSFLTSESETEWENPYDRLFNEYEKIDAIMRERERLERQYNEYLRKRNTKLSDLQGNTKQQLQTYDEEIKIQDLIAKAKEKELLDFIAASEYKNYITGYDSETGLIQIDWAAIESLEESDPEKGAKVAEFIDEALGYRDQQQEAIDAKAEAKQGKSDLFDRGRDQYFDLEQQIKDAIENARQKEIEKLEEINDSINDANSKILQSMQDRIAEYRQNRDNEKTEEEIANKQRRLAYLSQDTSGANALEILSLQKEIDEATEDYTDTLIDQKISDLQKQNDLAAEQRQRQIDIMNAQLDQYMESGAVWEDVKTLMDEGFGPDGIRVDSSLWKLLSESEDYASMSRLEKLKWGEELNDNVAEALLWLTTGGRSTKGLVDTGELSAGDAISFDTKDGETLEGTVQEDGTVEANGKIYSDVYQDSDGNYVTTETVGDGVEVVTSSAQGILGNLPHLDRNKGLKGTENIKQLQRGLNTLIQDGKLGNMSILDVNGDRTNKNTKAAVRKLQNIIGEKPADGLWGGETEYWFKNGNHDLKQYKTGGLADFTGPAWLDGTKSKPEYILNSDQTKAFFSLIDVLSGLRAMPQNSTSTENHGDNVYDIDINVESIGDDYSVEQMAQAVKRLITDDATYRNTNAINLKR